MAADRTPFGLAPRSWTVVRAGFAIVVLALLATYAGLPAAARWNARETQLRDARAQLAELRTLVASADAIDSAATARQSTLARYPRRVLRARSRAMAASALQSWVQELADASNLSVTRLDFADGGTKSGDLPIVLSAIGDVYGLSALLEQLRNGPRVLTVDKLTVQVNSALRGAPDVLQLTLTMHAPVVLE